MLYAQYTIYSIQCNTCLSAAPAGGGPLHHIYGIRRSHRQEQQQQQATKHSLFISTSIWKIVSSWKIVTSAHIVTTGEQEHV